MRCVSILGAMMVSLCAAAMAPAEQEVTLQSGAKLVGDVKMDGDDLLVDVDGATIKVPFKEVASVTSAKGGESNQPEQLLLKGLEAYALADGEKYDVGLLAEAFRLTPENPRMAFWYARGLIDAGNGKAASEVFEPRREAIAAAYPGAAERLASQIEARLALEELPSALVERLDQIAKSAALSNAIASKTLAYAAYFRLVDQNNEPIAKSAFRLQGNGENEHLESFSDGYHLYTFTRQNDYGDSPCRLEVSQPGLVGKTFEFQGSVRGAEDVGILRVKRLTDEDRKSFVARVVDPEGKPLAGATVAFTSANQMNGQEGIPPATTNADGEAKIVVFPNDYRCQVSLKNYNPITQQIVVPLDTTEPIEAEAKLYRAISAAIKVEWRAKLNVHPGMPQFRNNSVSTGEFEQRVGPGAINGNQVGRFGAPWVRLVQTDNKMQLQFMEHMHFPQAAATWVGRLTPEVEDSGNEKVGAAVNAELFDVLALNELDALSQEFKIERTNLGGMPGPGGPVSLPVDVGDVYLGRMNGMDPQSGQPAVIEFKILATELSVP